MVGLVNIMFKIVPLLILAGFIFTFTMMFSPKLRAKFMGQQIKTMKYMMDENEEILKELNAKGANVAKDGIEIKARAIKNGLFSSTIYCKYCGESIDADSKFCKNCGQGQ